MSEVYRTMDEIKAAYPDQWVLIDRPKSDRYQNVKGGYVIAHSSDPEDFVSVAEKLPKPFSLATIYTGPDVDDGSIFLL